MITGLTSTQERTAGAIQPAPPIGALASKKSKDILRNRNRKATEPWFMSLSKQPQPLSDGQSLPHTRNNFNSLFKIRTYYPSSDVMAARGPTH